jgi:hypothetical protein
MDGEMGRYGEIREDFFAERTRILEALALEENKHILMRLIGALAFRTHCPQFGYIQDQLGRVFTDIDFASYKVHFKDIISFLTELGYEEDKMVTRLFGEFRLLFHDPIYDRHIDIFFDKLEFSHILPLKGRLECDEHTLPLAELFLEKMQIARINEKDLIDTIMLLREHPVGEGDAETINRQVVGGLCSTNWGLWRTVTGNLSIVVEFLDRYPQLTEEDRQVVRARVGEMQNYLDGHPKTLRWRTRGMIGERIKWFKEVEELAHR